MSPKCVQEFLNIATPDLQILCKGPENQCPCAQPKWIETKYCTYVQLDVKNLPESSGKAWPSRVQLNIYSPVLRFSVTLGWEGAALVIQ